MNRLHLFLENAEIVPEKDHTVTKLEYSSLMDYVTKFKLGYTTFNLVASLPLNKLSLVEELTYANYLHLTTVSVGTVSNPKNNLDVIRYSTPKIRIIIENSEESEVDIYIAGESKFCDIYLTPSPLVKGSE